MLRINFFIFSSVIVFFASPLNSQSHYSLSEEKKLYNKIYDAKLNFEGYPKKELSSFYKTEPTLIALVYSRCTGVCNPFLLRLSQLLIQRANTNFQILVISFDKADKLDDMIALKKRFGLIENTKWTFAVTDSIESLLNSTGFEIKWDSLRQQYDHDAILISVNNAGLITKKITGERSDKELNSMINNSFTASLVLPNKNQLFSCFSYDEKTGSSKADWGLIILIAPAIMSFLFLTMINFFLSKKKTAVDSSP